MIEVEDWTEVRDRTGSSPVILHAPHGGIAVPAAVRGQFRLGETELAEEIRIMTDHGVDRLARIAATSTQASVMIDLLSRLVVDVERFPGPEEEKNAVGMGVLYTHGSQRQVIREVATGERAGLMAFFDAHSARMTQLVEQALARHGTAVIIDVHSYHTYPEPHELYTEEPRPPLCIGYEAPHMTPALRDMVAAAFAGFEQGDNQTFHGSYVPLPHYGRDARVQSVMLEIRRDQYMDERSGQMREAEVARLGAALSDLVRKVEDHFCVS
ncbi:N-formylglutamate amidohydrolase [Brachybacterium hainanense]|uniref:N-formylglutamate amidohydrolase n=1 Tax=Brachybacterium hainanense TaxID=1541174 RepID=A0ABV6R9F7_9MICO